MLLKKNKADVYIWDKKAGLLERTKSGYHFSYDKKYLALPDALPISLTLPLADKPHESNSLFPS